MMVIAKLVNLGLQRLALGRSMTSLEWGMCHSQYRDWNPCMLFTLSR